jgi:diguanylate cyclase (GGDEF)-like protein
MTAGRRAETGGTGEPASPPAPSESHGQELRALGEALNARTADVLGEVVTRRRDPGPVSGDGLVEDSLEQICTISTRALALWMTAGDPQAAVEAGREGWKMFGQLAVNHTVPLDDLTKRCLRWREAVDYVLGDIATRLETSPEVVAQAHSMVQLTLNVTLVRLCEVFGSERARTDEELARRQGELEFMATHDPLTRLPNRTLMIDRAEQMLVRSRQRTPVGALLMNIDNFKAINDTLGYGVGDELLQAIAARLDSVVRDTDALGRLGGDEFVLLCHEVSLPAGLGLIAERLMNAFGDTFELPGCPETDLAVTASIGIAIGDRKTAQDLLRDAEIAMHSAKWDGKNRYVTFEPGMQDAIQLHIELERDLRHALENNEFLLVYQPTFDLRDMATKGVEALIRWDHPKRGIVQPNDFIPLLEETGLIVDVGRWVLGEACRQGAAWHEAGHLIGMAVNVSARQLDTDEFIDDVGTAISESGLDAGALTIEITETTLMRNAEETVRRLTAVKELGVKIAIDDFGTGYSSLAHLQRFPVDSLKIDRSFISGLTENPEGETILRTLVHLGKSLSIETLAEGIEQPMELSLLQREQCDSGQGFLFARPLDAHDVVAFLQTWTAERAKALPLASHAA